MDEDRIKNIELDDVTPSVAIAVPEPSTAEIIRVSGCCTDAEVSAVRLDFVL